MSVTHKVDAREGEEIGMKQRFDGGATGVLVEGFYCDKRPRDDGCASDERRRPRYVRT